MLQLQQAQRIIVPGSTGSGADSEYVGLWHVDGHREHVAAVVLCLVRFGKLEGKCPQKLLDFGRCFQRFSSCNNADQIADLTHNDSQTLGATLRYYYHVDKSLHGGDMEFCGREPMDILGWGDCSNNYRSFGRESLRSALRGDARDPPKLANCRVPIRGSESNCQLPPHRR